MGISAISGTMNYQALQAAGQKNNNQAIRQAQTAPQTSPEEKQENSAVQSKETSQGSEATEAKSINIYA